MTTLNQARTAIYEEFQAAWGATTPFTFDNEKYTPPDTEWARLTVRHTASTQDTLGAQGNRRFERIGSVFIQIFVPTNQGTTRADELATIARETFEGKSLTGTTIRFLDVIVRETGVDGQYYVVVVEATFQYDETR